MYQKRYFWLLWSNLHLYNWKGFKSLLSDWVVIVHNVNVLTMLASWIAKCRNVFHGMHNIYKSCAACFISTVKLTINTAQPTDKTVLSMMMLTTCNATGPLSYSLLRLDDAITLCLNVHKMYMFCIYLRHLLYFHSKINNNYTTN